MHRLKLCFPCVIDRSPDLQIQLELTLHDEVDPGSLGVVVCLHRAGVRALVIHVHVLDHDAILGWCVDQDDHTRVYGPLVTPSVEDGAAV